MRYSLEKGDGLQKTEEQNSEWIGQVSDQSVAEKSEEMRMKVVKKGRYKYFGGVRWRDPDYYPHKFGGKTYKYHTATASKSAAKAVATELRAKGLKVRVAAGKDFGGRGWCVYKRRA